ncbi:signal peptidase II [Euzebya sp.]|uniref:signal peptidase II n=1 Tax=Euzebya sp. TaxID=1971409 RepID=UPI003515A979
MAQRTGRSRAPPSASRLQHRDGVQPGRGQPRVLILSLTGMAVLALAVTAWPGHLGGRLPARLIVGGGLANLLDRASGGGVVDLFDLGWFPVFNVADVFITAGVALLLLTAAADDRTDVYATPRTVTDDSVNPQR